MFKSATLPSGPFTSSSSSSTSSLSSSLVYGNINRSMPLHTWPSQPAVPKYIPSSARNTTLAINPGFTQIIIMAAANNFGIFMNAVTLLDFTCEILGCVRPQAQMQKLEVALKNVRDELEEAIRKDVDIQGLESRLMKCRDQYRAIHLRVNAETALRSEVLDFGKGLTWKMYRLAEELKFLRRDIMVAIRDTQSSARIVPTRLAQQATQSPAPV